jgi:nucleoside-diphosphate-sugar epimerase
MGTENTNGYTSTKVLVTGASGFIGSHLCARLTQLGAGVHAVSRQPRETDATITWHQGDLSDTAAVQDLFGSIRPDIVFHLASEVKGGRDLKLVMPTFNSNLLSTVNLLVAAAETGCKRIVMAGSLEEPAGEGSALVPSSPYAAAKAAASAYARMFHALYATPVALARIFMVYGPGQQDLLKLVPYVALSLLRGESPRLSSGQRPVDWIYVEDVVNGLLAMGLAPGIDGCTLDLGSGELVTTRRVVELLGEIVAAGVPLEFGTLPDRPLEQVRVANVADTARILGWKPGVSLRRGLEKTVEWCRHLGDGL